MTSISATPPSFLNKGTAPTPIVDAPELAARAGVGRVSVKLESDRALGNFKSLGGVYAGLRALSRAAGVTVDDLIAGDFDAPLPRLICASDGNHGLAVAEAARQAGAEAWVYLGDGVSSERADRIVRLGATVKRVTGTYDVAVAQALEAAFNGRGLLVADTTDDIDDPVVNDVMTGYGVLMQELKTQFICKGPPTHQFIQAGVGGLAAAMAEGWAASFLTRVLTVTVEPETAACVAAALAAGRPVQIPGSLETAAEMLSCGLASRPALERLARNSVQAVTVSEAALHEAVTWMEVATGRRTTASGAAGLAGLLHAASDAASRARLGISSTSHVLLVLSEGA